MKEMSKVLFNTIEEMNECYGISAELPRSFHSNADLVCYEIENPYLYEYLTQYKFIGGGFYHLDNSGEPVIHNRNQITSDSEVYEDDAQKYEGRCFVYVRVNEYLRKHLEKTLIGCEFVRFTDKTETPYREFVHNVEVITSGIIVTNQNGLSCYLNKQLLYPDDHSGPIPYKEWVKKINEQDLSED